MINIINYFEKKSINKFLDLGYDFIRNPKQFSELVHGVQDELNTLGVRILQEILEMADEQIRDSHERKKRWVVESCCNKSLITSLGEVQFAKTLFKRKDSGKSEYLLDKIMGLEKHERISEDALTVMFEEAVQTSYRRGGKEISPTAGVEKQTVKNKIHELRFPLEREKPVTKKVVDYLYIEADEDHVSLQFREVKGDLINAKNNRKNNCLMTKLVYVHEGIKSEAPKSKRHRLINPHYFCDTSYGSSNDDFWDSIYEYIDTHYELSRVKKIYVNADGGSWITSGMKRLPNTTYVLDEFHLEEYLMKLTTHMKDSRSDALDELREAIRNGTKQDFMEVVERLKCCLEGENGIDRINDGMKYILSNWTPAKLRLRRRSGVVGSSTEGHVSHVLSSRMSSRPMGWSIKGATQMARLRAYALNGGDMLELVRYQKVELPKAAGAEYDNILSCTDILRSEKNSHEMIGKYVESIRHTVSAQCAKQFSINHHLRLL